MSTTLETTLEGQPTAESSRPAGKTGRAMKISCDREQLLQAFQTVASVAPSRSPKPILQNVKLEVTDKSAVLLATDLEVGIRHQVTGVDIESPGVVVLSVSRFGSILRESTDQTLHLESDSTGTTIRGERSQFRLPAEDPAEFPSVTAFDEADFHTVPARLLRELIRRTAFATDNESSRYALGGVKLEVEGDQLTAIGTDGRRLAKMTGPVGTTGKAIDATQTTIVPTRAMTLIERAVAPTDEEVRIAVKGNEFFGPYRTGDDFGTIARRAFSGLEKSFSRVGRRWREARFGRRSDPCGRSSSGDRHERRKPWRRFDVWRGDVGPRG